MARPSLFLVALVALLGAPTARAAPPYDLSNFQNELSCAAPTTGGAAAAAAADPLPPTPLLVRPRTLADVQRAVRSYSAVRAVGAGHSWNAPFFCPGPPTATPDNNASAGAAGVAMTAIRPVRIVVDEDSRTVTADAGVILADLIEFLSNYASARAPAGYTLPAYPWFVYQTVGGAVATGTHGSSVMDGSLSAQLAWLDLVTADGSLRRLSDDRDAFLMRAARVSSGRLGILARAAFRIVPEEPVRRELRLISDSAFLGLLRQAQDRWNAAGGARDGTGLPSASAEPRARRDALLVRAKAALPRWTLDGQAFWLPERRAFYLVTFTRAGEAGCGGAFNASSSSTAAGGGGDNSTFSLTPVLVSASGRPSTTDDGQDDAACAAFLRNFRPQETTLYNSTRRAYVPGEEPAVPSAGFGAKDEEMRLGDALRPLAPAAAVAGGRDDDGSGLPYASSLAALRTLASRRLDSPLPAANNDSSLETGARGVAWQPPKRRIRPSGAYALPDGTSLSMSGVAYVAGNRTAESASIYLRQPERTLGSLRETVYFQHEVAVPLSTAADCLAELVRVAAAARELDADGAADGGASSPSWARNTTSTTGFFTAPLIRFVGPEDALLSLSGLDHGVSVFVNAEDYLSYRADGGAGRDGAGRRNPAFKRAMAVLRGSPACKGSRLHLGKAGWPERGCWRGDEEYGDRWCDFGCAVRALDPTGKFADAAPDRFTWRGARLDDGCCGASGFLSGKPGCACRVAHERAPESCPPPPYY